MTAVASHVNVFEILGRGFILLPQYIVSSHFTSCIIRDAEMSGVTTGLIHLSC